MYPIYQSNKCTEYYTVLDYYTFTFAVIADYLALLCLQCSVVCFVVSWCSLNKSEFEFFICSYLFFVQFHLDGLASG